MKQGKVHKNAQFGRTTLVAVIIGIAILVSTFAFFAGKGILSLKEKSDKEQVSPQEPLPEPESSPASSQQFRIPPVNVSNESSEELSALLLNGSNPQFNVPQVENQAPDNPPIAQSPQPENSSKPQFSIPQVPS